MRILIKVLTGIVWSILFLVVSASVGALAAYGLATLLNLVGLINPSSINNLTAIISRMILIFGTIAGFYIGYSRTLKKDEQQIDNKRLIKKLIVLCSFLFLIGMIGYIVFLNIRAYKKYGYYVHVSDEDVFTSKIDPRNVKILDHGRMKKDKIIRLDNRLDSGDGQEKGKVRWYECFGIDCDEGWENHFSD